MPIKTVSLILLSAALAVTIACGRGTAAPSVDIDATVEARLKERLAAVPTPTARVVEKEVIKEVIVEKIVVVTATPPPTPTPQIIIKEVVVTATPTPTPTATPGQIGQVNVHYYASSDPGYVSLLEDLKAYQYLESVADSLNVLVAWPHDLLLSIGECGEANAYYDPEYKQVVMCLEFISVISEELAPLADTVEQLTLWTEGAYAHIFYHEIGHALIDILELPAVGKEEDAVDQLAALVLLGSAEVEALDAAIAFLYITGTMQAHTVQQLPFWDEHSLGLQRAYDMMCLAYGYDQSHFATYLDFLPQERAQNCSHEYTRISSAWDALLEPHLK